MWFSVACVLSWCRVMLCAHMCGVLHHACNHCDGTELQYAVSGLSRLLCGASWSGIAGVQCDRDVQCAVR